MAESYRRGAMFGKTSVFWEQVTAAGLASGAQVM
jgi:hypothetical protein